MILGGVCAGMARHLGWPLAVTRVAAVALSVVGGAGILLYLWLWALVPAQDAPAGASPQVRREAPVALILVAAATIALWFVIIASDSRTTVAALLAVTVASGGAVAWSLLFDGNDAARPPAYGVVVRTIASALLLLAGTVTLLNRPDALSAVVGVGVVVLGVGVLAAPRIFALRNDLQASRTARVREEQRAEIAAHLHDSVLQTLALIQNRAGASSEVARIARAQERELRDWLFVGDSPVADDLAAELKEVAGAIELDYAARIEVVATGESVSGAGALVGAAREAMLNAARHAGGEVSVYLETSPGAIDVFIRDRGPGVDLSTLSADRLGIRESIIGRMTRAGGSASVRPAATGTGTEVHLHLEHSND